ncbi:MAG: hypothetical protein QOJ29_2767 [Thermoleophilaceae bacterium]|nr:hypothetical protein [Thermoleophilaceae bacterium]
MKKALLVVAVVLAALPATADARPTCDAARAAAKSCSGCHVTLKGSAFGDTDPKADGVGLTAGDSATLKVTVSGCKLPAGARIEFRSQRLDSFGRPAGAVQKRDCAKRKKTCSFKATKPTSGEYVFQAFLIGCSGGKKSKKLHVAWAPKKEPDGGPTPGGGTPPNPNPTVVMTFNQVSADSGYVSSQCTVVQNPPGLSGHEELDGPGAYHHTYDWTLPTTISEGNSATVHVRAESRHNGSESAQIAFKPPSEFGSSEGLFAVNVVADPNSSKEDGKTTTFHPTRAFTLGEKLYIRLETGCAAWIYEYVGQ